MIRLKMVVFVRAGAFPTSLFVRVSHCVPMMIVYVGRPLARWQQVRDVEHSMESAIWQVCPYGISHSIHATLPCHLEKFGDVYSVQRQFRTRTGPYACSQSGDSIDANEALLNAVVANRAKILGQANMQVRLFVSACACSAVTCWPEYLFPHIKSLRVLHMG